MIEKITLEITEELKNTVPKLTPEQIIRKNKILNSDNPDFVNYGHKISDIENIVKNIYKKYQCSYENALAIFKSLVSSNVHEEKFAGVFLLNHFKRNFNQATIDLFEVQFSKHCDTWAICDTSCIRVIGPFLGININQELAENTIEKWAKSENLWVRRASMVILLKIIMIKKGFDEDYVFEFVEKMVQYPEDYIQKAIGWLLKICSKYNPNSIFNYLMKNKERFSRLILRYAREKLPNEMRTEILNK